MLNLKKALMELSNRLVDLYKGQKPYALRITSSMLTADGTNYVAINSNHTFFVSRVGNIVIINVDCEKKNLSWSNVTVFFTLPYGYRPINAVLDSIIPQNNDGKAVMVFIQNSGNFNMFTPNVGTGRLTGTIAYLTNDDYPS